MGRVLGDQPAGHPVMANPMQNFGGAYPQPMPLHQNSTNMAMSAPVMAHPGQAQGPPAIRATKPVLAECPFCHQSNVTITRKQVGATIVVASSIMCVVGMGLCAFVPCILDDLKDTIHECPTCGNVVTIVKRHDTF